MSNAETVSRRLLITSVVSGALSIWACSVYSPSDIGNNGATFDEGGNASGGVGRGGSVGASGSGGGNPLGGTGAGGFASGGSGGKTTGGSGATSAAGSGGAQPTSGGAGSGGKAATGGKATTGGDGGDGGDAGSSATTGGANTGGATTGGKASGGSGGGAVTGGAATGGTGPTYPPELIDDMEDGNQYIIQQEKRDGAWYTAVDDGAVDPPMAKAFAMAEITGTPGAKGSTHAFHFKGTAGTMWGAMGAFDFHTPATTTPSKLPYDASSYKGITFWVKAAAASTSTVKLRIAVKDTVADAGGACKTMTNGCDNHFAAPLAVTTAWKQVSFVWADFKQEPGWGYQTTFNSAQLISVQFAIPTVAAAATQPTADVWIDDIAFVP
ncbi:MAG TPA: carbohydrate binding domain-containing protein [Polyangiaceae bacterium]|nr:carbohydrate binding domain-containing protein [Polyangiaceae bacterium]